MTDEWERAEKQKKLRKQWEGVTSFVKMLFKELEEENEKLKKINSETISELNHINGDLIIKLEKAKEIIRELINESPDTCKSKWEYECWSDVLNRAEAFLKEDL